MNIQKNQFILIFMAFVLGIMISSCSENPAQIKAKLNQVLQSDLRYMVAEVENATQKKFLLEKPFYVIKDYKEFQGDSARIYSAYCKVDFHYLKNDFMIRERKYRYHVGRRFWDRYSKKLLHNKLNTKKK